MTLFSPAETFGRIRQPGALEAPLQGRPCACGGMVFARPDRPGHAVRSHNETAAHLRWWKRVEPVWAGFDREEAEA